MDSDLYEELKSLLEGLTHSGSALPGETDVKKLKVLCKKSEGCVRSAHELLMHHLAEEHAEVRLSAHCLVDELFRRSHTFRECLIDTFQEYLALAVGVDADRPLPPPAAAAKLLKARTLLSIKHWTETYGGGYPKLKLSYNYLKYNLRVDFENLVAQSQAERRRIEQQEQQQREAASRRLAAIRARFIEGEEEVESTLTEMGSCFELLFPRLDGPDLYQSTPPPPPPTPPPPRPAAAAVVAVCCDPLKGAGQSSEPSGDDSHSTLCGSDRIVESCSNYDNDMNDDSDSNGDSDSNDSDSGWMDVPDDVTQNVEEEEGPLGPSPSSRLQAHGIPTQSYSVTVELPTSGRVVIEEAEDNTSILRTLYDCERIVRSSLLPACCRTIESLAKLEGAGGDVRLALDRRSRLQAALQKYKELKIVNKSPERTTQDGSTSSSSSRGGCQLDRVSGELGTAHPDNKTEWAFRKPLSAVEEESADPTSLAAQLKAREKMVAAQPQSTGNHDNRPRTSGVQVPQLVDLRRKAGLLAKAPVVPFGTDLLHWEAPEERVGLTPAVHQFESLHRFWFPHECEVVVPPDDNHRIITFGGQFEPVDRACRVPLPSGKLCPRRDRQKCPFHGTIVPRDELGAPLDPGQQPPTTGSSASREQWQEVGAEVGRVLGVDLTSTADKKGKGRKGKATRKKYPGLTDLKALHNTSRKRLEKIVLSRKSLERVAQSTDRMDERKFDDKFGNNYNYALN